MYCLLAALLWCRLPALPALPLLPLLPLPPLLLSSASKLPLPPAMPNLPPLCSPTPALPCLCPTGCPFCRKVREAVNILDLDVLFKPCPKVSC